jgi:hypothetical protein
VKLTYLILVGAILLGGAGQPTANDTPAPSAAQRGAIGDYVRRCWSTDPGRLDLDRMEVLIIVTTDNSGVVRRATAAPEDDERVNAEPQLRLFAMRAIRAVMDPNCANLPLPQTLLGQPRTITFRFGP